MAILSKIEMTYGSVWQITLGLVVIFIIGRAIYNVFIHPLSRFPGPKLWAFSRFPYGFYFLKGRLHERIKDLHDQYGPVVRVAPDELSFIKDEAWSGIYMGQNGNKGFPKHKVYHKIQGFESIVDAPDESHTRLRKLLKTGFFSQRNARIHEQHVQTYIGYLIDGLRTHHAQPSDGSTSHEVTPANMRDWYNWTSVDIIGRLTLSEDFECLKKRIDNPWLVMFQTHMWLSAVLILMRHYPPLPDLLNYVVPKKQRDLQETFINIIRTKVKRRWERKLPSGESDYISTASHEGSSGDSDLTPLTGAEIEANCLLIMLAGSETLATSLLASTHLLCQRPAVLHRLEDEVRSIAPHESDITSDLISSRMPYLNAVIREAHRLCPPLAYGFARVVGNSGAVIAGHAVPAGTAVGVTQWAANRSALNFARPNDFLPERWLSPEQFKNYTVDDEILDLDIFAHDVQDVVRPFSAGGRDCMGQNLGWVEFRLLLARMVWNFDIAPHQPAKGASLETSSFRNWSDQKAFLIWQKEPYHVLLKEVAR